jgi:rod shape-determining protein MreD
VTLITRQRRINVKKLVIPLILLILVGLQNSLFEYIRIFGVKPDIVITFVICFTLVKGNPRGTVVGIAGGVMEDVFFGGAFGINSLACMITAFVIGSIEGKLYKDNMFVPGIFAFMGTVVKESIVFLFLYLTRQNLDIASVMTNIIVREAVYDTILAALFFRYVAKLTNWLYTEQSWKL